MKSSSKENKIVIITPEYALKHKLIKPFPNLTDNKAKRILLAYGRVLRKRLSEGNGYSLILENNRDMRRKIINFMIKIVRKDKDYYGRVSRLGKFTKGIVDVDACMMNPTLKLTVDTQNNSVNNNEIDVASIYEFKLLLGKIPINERHKFANA